jgi:hypothetical protein
LATSLDRFKGQLVARRCARAATLIFLVLTAPSPFGAVPHNPIGQRTFKADVMTGFFRFNPLVLQNFFPLGREFAVQ